MQQQRGKDNGRQRLQIAAHGDRLHRQHTNGGEIAPAAETGAHDSQQQDPRPVTSGNGHGQSAAAQQQQKHGRCGGQHLQQRIFHTVHALCLLIQNQHHRIANSTHDAIEKP